MHFSEDSLRFLFENRLNDSKEWFRAHADEYHAFITEPFTELVEKLVPKMRDIDSRLVCTPKKISRLYRDLRFAKNDPSIFHDAVWWSCGHSPELYWGLPGFFFEFSPQAFRYGMGYYQASTSSMQAIRSLILAGDPAWEEALDCFEQQTRFSLTGEFFKKDRYPDADARIANWLNRKGLCLAYENTVFDEMFDEDFADILAADYQHIAPIYAFLMKAENTVGCDRTR